VESVRLLAARGQQARRAEPVEEPVEQSLLGPAGDEAAAELDQDRVVEARVGQLEGERVFPVEPAPDRVGGFAIGEPLDERQHRGERQARGRFGRLPADGEQVRERRVVVRRAAERIGDPEAARAFGERRAGNAGGVERDRAQGLRLK